MLKICVNYILNLIWEYNTRKDRGLAAMPASSKVFYDLGTIKVEDNITSGNAHIAVSYEKVLKYELVL